jgi:hypothetical protein
MSWPFSKPGFTLALVIAKKSDKLKHGHFIAVMMKLSL